MCGASSEQKAIGQQQSQAFTALQAQASQIFGSSSKIFSDLTSAFEPILAAGPGQEGFTVPEKAGLQSRAITETGEAYKHAQQAAGERIAASGGGNAVLPAGSTAALQARIASEGAGATAEQLSNIDLESAQLGRQNWLAAGQVLGNAPSVFGVANTAAGEATQAGGAAEKTAGDIQQADRAWVGDVMGVLGDAAQVGAGFAGCPVKGSNILMSDGTPKKVEDLKQGDKVKGIDGGICTVLNDAEGQLSNAVEVSFYDNIARVSESHTFALPRGGYAYATEFDTKNLGVQMVFPINIDGSHSYCVDGCWSLS